MNTEQQTRRAIINALKEPLNPVGVRIEALADRILDAFDEAGLVVTLAPRPVGQPVIVGIRTPPSDVDRILGRNAMKREGEE